MKIGINENELEGLKFGDVEVGQIFIDMDNIVCMRVESWDECDLNYVGLNSGILYHHADQDPIKEIRKNAHYVLD